MRFSSSRKLHGAGLSFVHALPLSVKADEHRTILLPSAHGKPDQVREILEYVRDLPEEDFQQEWEGVCGVFQKRHRHFPDLLAAGYDLARHIGGVTLDTQRRQLLAGSF